MSDEDRKAELALALMQNLHDQRDRENDTQLVGCVVPTCGEMTRAGSMCSDCTISALVKLCGDEHLPYRLDAAIREAADLRLAIKRGTQTNNE